MLAVLCVGAVGVEEVVVTEAFPPAQACQEQSECNANGSQRVDFSDYEVRCKHDISF